MINYMKTIIKPLPQPYRFYAVEQELKYVDQQLDKAWENIKSTLELPTFPKGQVPRPIAEKKFGKEVIYKTALDQFVRMAIEKSTLKVCNISEVKVEWPKQGNPLVLYFICELMPKVTSSKYKEIKVERNDLKVSDEEIDSVLQRTALGEAEQIIVPDQISDSHEVEVQFIAQSVDEAEKPIEEIANVPNCIVSTKKITYGFEEYLKGKKIGDKVECIAATPLDFFQEDLRGKKLQYICEIKNVTQTKIPEINDELAVKVGFSNLEEMKSTIIADLQKDKDKTNEILFREQVMSNLVSVTEFNPIPDFLVKQELNSLLTRLVRDNNTKNGTTYSEEDFLKKNQLTLDQWYAGNWNKALRKIQVQLVLEYIVQEEKIVSSQQECVEDLKKDYPTEEQIDLTKIDFERLTQILNMRKAQDFVIKIATIK